MPIRPEHRRHYGWTWRTVTRPQVWERAEGICDACGRRLPRKGWNCAHRNGRPGDDRLENLLALHARCHARFDAPAAQEAARDTRARRKDAFRPLLAAMEKNHREDPMREHSVYHVMCECGREFETRDSRALCPHCGRQIEIHWRPKEKREDPPAPEKSP